MARYTTSAENSCAWQAAGIRPRRNVAARFVALSFMLCSFVAELHQIGRPSPSELSGHAANRRRWFTTTCGTLLLRSSDFEPVLYAALLWRRLYSSHCKGIVFFLLLFVKYSADPLHHVVLKGAKTLDPSSSRN